MRFRLLPTLLALAASSFAQVDPNRLVAVVNGEEIRGAEYYRYMEYMDLKDAYQRFRNLLYNFPAGYLALDQLITEKLMLQLAKTKGAVPLEPEVDQEIGYAKEQSPKLLEEWAAKGRTPAEMRAQARYDIAVFKLQTLGITVTDQEVDKYYRDNAVQFTSPKLFKLRLIALTDVASKDKVDAELRSGKAFAEVAKQYSDDVTKLAGGEYGTVPLTSMPEALSKPISDTKIGQSTAWAEFQGKHVKFFLEDVLPEKLQPMTPTLRRQIRRKLMLDRGKVKIDLAKELSAARVKAKVDIKQKEFAEIYKKLMETAIPVSDAKPGALGG